MTCPSCGATIKQQDQRYCQDCGTALAAAGAPATAIAPRPAGVDLPATGGTARGAWMQLLPSDLRNRMLMGAGAVVLAVFVLYVLVNAIVSFFLHLVLPAAVILAILYGGYRFLRARAS
jgi:hypothetical protein